MHTEPPAQAGAAYGRVASASSTPPASIESVWIEPPAFVPPTIAVPSAPPPMLVQVVAPRPFARAVWIGGYWIWQRRWVWAQGMWAAAPATGLRWVHPSYEHRDGLVLFVTGHWADDIAGGKPPARQRIAAVAAAGGGDGGCAPLGPQGCFVPAPPASRPGLIVPAPAGTPPAVMTGVPAIVAAGMRVAPGAPTVDGVAQMMISAPASATANGRRVQMLVPALAELAASMPARAQAWAPRPRSELSLRFVAPAMALADRQVA